MNEKINQLIDKCIQQGSIHSTELHDTSYELESLLGDDHKSMNIRNYFDSWADAVNHDYMVYPERDPNVWIEAAKELKAWYNGQCQLKERKLWNDCDVKNI